MQPEQDLALRRGGKILKLRQQLDNLFAQFRDQQTEQEQQVQELFGQGNGYLQRAQALKEGEALLEQLKLYLRPERGGRFPLPLTQAQEMVAALCAILEQEEEAARLSLQKSLQQAAGALLNCLEVSREIGQLGELRQQAAAWGEELASLVAEEAGAIPQGGSAGVGNPAEHL